MRRLPVVLLLTVVGVLALAGPALAHTELVQTAPVDGGTAEADLDDITLTFTKAVDPRLATVAVRSEDGELKSEGAPRGKGVALVQTLGALIPGRYDVQWRATAADAHILTGGFEFRVGKASTAPPVTPDDAGGLSPVELLRQHAEGNFDHDALPSYAVGSSRWERDRQKADRANPDRVPVKLGPPAAPVALAAEPSAPEPDNGSTTIIALLFAALIVTSGTAVVELRRA